LVRTVSVRRARREDLDALSLLHRRLLRFHEDLDRRFGLDLVGLSCLEEILAPLLAKEGWATFVAQGDDILGFITGRVVEDGYGFVEDIFVEERARRQGIGRVLFSSLCEWFKESGVRVVQTYVACRNEEAQAFWRGLGFQDFFGKLWHEVSRKRPVMRENLSIFLRPAELRDERDISNFQRQMMMAEMALDPRAKLFSERLKLLQWDLTHWLGRDDCRVLVAESLEEEMVGYIAGHIAATAPVFFLSQRGHISDIYVSQERRRKGIGGRLYLELEDWYRREGIPVALVEILHKDALSQRFFKGLGFEDYVNCLWYDLGRLGKTSELEKGRLGIALD